MSKSSLLERVNTDSTLFGSEGHGAGSVELESLASSSDQGMVGGGKSL